eukprot:CAMPEP_0179076748 /NCGR_PEP_ID=MMETSP0796-20121207/34259_1 /TAXON_ID=73915 /ORGANISM="Pyrodinium bahamense, Strain pbaha01" /LENGTH=217 /DNA_ID=CAMNT_0020774007 /DNA_START=126 /DNA_END=780 /DNA_ORIENTATION=+
MSRRPMQRQGWHDDANKAELLANVITSTTEQLSTLEAAQPSAALFARCPSTRRHEARQLAEHMPGQACVRKHTSAHAPFQAAISGTGWGGAGLKKRMHSTTSPAAMVMKTAHVSALLAGKSADPGGQLQMPPEPIPPVWQSGHLHPPGGSVMSLASSQTPPLINVPGWPLGQEHIPRRAWPEAPSKRAKSTNACASWRAMAIGGTCEDGGRSKNNGE